MAGTKQELITRPMATVAGDPAAEAAGAPVPEAAGGPAPETADDLSATAGRQPSHGVYRRMTKVAPDALVSTVAGLFNSRIVLGKPVDIQRFHHVRSILAPFCNETSASLTNLPTVAACWGRSFCVNEVNPKTLFFDKVPSIESFFQRYKANRYRDQPFVAMLLTELEKLPELQDKAPLSLAKIIFGYVADVAMQLCPYNINTDAVNVGRIIAHILKIMTIVRDDVTIRSMFEDTTHEGFKWIYAKVVAYLDESQSIIETQKIPIVLATLADCFSQVLAAFTRFLLATTEGGNDDKLPIAYEEMVMYRFTDKNPLKNQIIQSAEFIPKLQTSAVTVLPIGLCLPEIGAVQEYVTKSADTKSLGPFNRPPVTHLVLSIVEPNDRVATRIRSDVHLEKIKDISQKFVRWARWQELLLFFTQFTYNLSRMAALNGQNLNATEAKFLLDTLGTLKAYIVAFKNEMKAVRDEFTKVVSSSRTSYENAVFSLIGTMDLQIEHSISHGFTPLDNIEIILAHNRITRDIVSSQVFSAMEGILKARALSPDGTVLPEIMSVSTRSAAARTYSIAPIDGEHNLLDTRDDAPSSSHAEAGPANLIYQGPYDNSPSPQRSSSQYSANKPRVNPWQKIVLICLGVAALTFVLMSVVFLTGGASLPLVFLGLGLLQGTLVLSGLGALTSFAVSFIGLSLFHQKPTVEPQNPMHNSLQEPFEPRHTSRFEPLFHPPQRPNPNPDSENLTGSFSPVVPSQAVLIASPPAVSRVQEVTGTVIDATLEEGKAIIMSDLMQTMVSKHRDKQLKVNDFTEVALKKFVQVWASSFVEKYNQVALPSMESMVTEAFYGVIHKRMLGISDKLRESILKTIRECLDFSPSDSNVSNQSMFRPAPALGNSSFSRVASPPNSNRAISAID